MVLCFVIVFTTWIAWSLVGFAVWPTPEGNVVLGVATWNEQISWGSVGWFVATWATFGAVLAWPRVKAKAQLVLEAKGKESFQAQARQSLRSSANYCDKNDNDADHQLPDQLLTNTLGQASSIPGNVPYEGSTQPIENASTSPRDLS